MISSTIQNNKNSLIEPAPERILSLLVQQELVKLLANVDSVKSSLLTVRLNRLAVLLSGLKQEYPESQSFHLQTKLLITSAMHFQMISRNMHLQFINFWNTPLSDMKWKTQRILANIKRLSASNRREINTTRFLAIFGL